MNLTVAQVATSPAGERSNLKVLRKRTDQEKDDEDYFMANVKVLLTTDEYSSDGGKWRTRWRERAKRDLCERVMVDAAKVKAEGCIVVGTYAGMMEDNWQRWGGRELDRKNAAR